MSSEGCSCPAHTRAPWRTRGGLLGPGSAFGGVFVLAIVVAVGVALDPRPRQITLAAAVGVVVVAGLVSAVVLLVRGHRGGCLIGRSAYCSVAVPGVPIRVLWAIAEFFNW